MLFFRYFATIVVSAFRYWVVVHLSAEKHSSEAVSAAADTNSYTHFLRGIDKYVSLHENYPEQKTLNIL